MDHTNIIQKAKLNIENMNKMVKDYKDIENIISALGEASITGLFNFVGKNKLQSIVEVVHVFDKDKLTPGLNLPAVRITIEPLSESETINLDKKRQSLIN